MNWEIVVALSEVMGVITLLATLFYLALQIRLNMKAIASSAELEASRIMVESCRRMIADPVLRAVWDKVADGKELSSEERGIFLWYVAETFFAGEGVFIQYKKKFFSNELWEQQEKIMRGHLQHPVAMTWWNNRNTPFTEEFQNHMDQVIQEPPKWLLPNVVETGASKS